MNKLPIVYQPNPVDIYRSYALDLGWEMKWTWGFYFLWMYCEGHFSDELIKGLSNGRF